VIATAGRSTISGAFRSEATVEGKTSGRSRNFGVAGGFLYMTADAKMQSLREAFSLQRR
jgi:hypothetical protein